MSNQHDVRYVPIGYAKRATSKFHFVKDAYRYMPTTDGHHLGLTIQGHGSSVTLTLTGQQPAGPLLFQLPAFVNNIVSASAGTVNQQPGTVTLSPTVRSVTVQLKQPAG